MSPLFKKKEVAQINPSGSAQNFDAYQKSRMTAGDLYGMRSKDLNNPINPDAVPQFQEMQVPRAPFRGPITPPLPSLPGQPEMPQPEQDMYPPMPARPMPVSIPMGPSRYSEESAPMEMPEPPAPEQNPQYPEYTSTGYSPDYNEPQEYSIPEPLPPAPSMPPMPNSEYREESYSRPSASEQVELLTEDLEKIARGIIEEKLQGAEEIISKLAEVNDVISEIDGLKEQMKVVNDKVDALQKAIVSKVDDYNKSITDVNSELTAVGKVFDKLIPEFTKDVGDLKGIVDKKLSAPRRSPGRPRKRKRKSKSKKKK